METKFSQKRGENEVFFEGEFKGVSALTSGNHWVFWKCETVSHFNRAQIKWVSTWPDEKKEALRWLV